MNPGMISCLMSQAHVGTMSLPNVIVLKLFGLHCIPLPLRARAWGFLYLQPPKGRPGLFMMACSAKTGTAVAKRTIRGRRVTGCSKTQALLTIKTERHTGTGGQVPIPDPSSLCIQRVLARMPAWICVVCKDLARPVDLSRNMRAPARPSACEHEVERSLLDGANRNLGQTDAQLPSCSRRADSGPRSKRARTASNRSQ